MWSTIKTWPNLKLCKKVMLGELYLDIYEEASAWQRTSKYKGKIRSGFWGILICCKLIIDDFCGEFCSLDLLWGLEILGVVLQLILLWKHWRIWPKMGVLSSLPFISRVAKCLNSLTLLFFSHLDKPSSLETVHLPLRYLDSASC